jgi:hypothetical protein
VHPDHRATAALLGPRWAIEDPRFAEIKGKGTMRVFRLLGRAETS